MTVEQLINMLRQIDPTAKVVFDIVHPDEHCYKTQSEFSLREQQWSDYTSFTPEPGLVKYAVFSFESSNQTDSEFARYIKPI